jgi:hypothetical protein
MRTRLMVAISAALLLGLVLCGCGRTGSDAPTTVAPADIGHGALQWAECAIGAPEPPFTEAAPDFFDPSASDDGELVPDRPSAVAVCPPGGLYPFSLTGTSLMTLVRELNGADASSPQSCTDQYTSPERLVFRYPDGHRLPVAISGSSCGWAGNGAQVRVGFITWLNAWEDNLARALKASRRSHPS